jgi:hypothetical protein
MSRPKAMTRSIEAPDPLSSAIADFRMELLQWIDTALAGLRERERADELVMEEERTAARASQLSAPSGRPGVSNERPYFQAEVACEAPPPRARVVDRESIVETARPPIARPETQLDLGPPSPLSNPRQRLDALARLLDHRLKQGQAAADDCAGKGRPE